jgi:phage terminase Nu1 subunit (DNA packaging protein)
MRLTLDQAAAEFAIDRRTLARRLSENQIAPGEGGYSILQCHRACFGDIDEEKLRLTKEQADKLGLENQMRRGELVEVRVVAESINRAIGSIRGYVLGLTHLPEEDRDEILLKCKALYESAFGNPGDDTDDVESAAAPNG